MIGNTNREIATIGGGCFWCLDAVFAAIKGVEKVESGYAGGESDNPNYSSVSSGRTGHAEVVQITFDPQVITYEKLLEVFFGTHDPTTMNRQGADVGSQYRSIILFHSPEQEKVVRAVVEKTQTKFSSPIVTEVKSYTKFYRAEDYHQNYFPNHPENSYCSLVIAPKVDKVKKSFGDLLRGK